MTIFLGEYVVISHNNISRRAVLASIGTGIVSTGAVIGQPDIDAVRKQPERRGRDTTIVNGIVVQFENCKTVHIRGSERNLIHGEVVTWEAGAVTDGEVDPDLWDTFVSLPKTSTTSGAPGEPSSVTLHSVQLETGERGSGEKVTVTPPDAWDCKGLVEEYIREREG